MLGYFAVAAEPINYNINTNSVSDAIGTLDSVVMRRRGSSPDFTVLSSESSAGLDLDMRGHSNLKHRDTRNGHQDHHIHELANPNNAALFSSLSPATLSEQEDIDIDDPDEIYATVVEQQMMMLELYDIDGFYDASDDLAPIKSMEIELQDKQSLNNNQTQAGLRIVPHASASDNGAMTTPITSSNDVYKTDPNQVERESFNVIQQPLVMLIPSTPELELRFRQDSFLNAGVCSCLVEVYCRLNSVHEHIFKNNFYSSIDFASCISRLYGSPW